MIAAILTTTPDRRRFVAISKGNPIPQFPAVVNPVIEWNRTLLVIVRTPGAQPATIHPTRSFAIMHGAIYDAVNAIDRKHRPYVVSLSEQSPNASEEAAAAAAAHEVLLALYPAFKTYLDTELQKSLGQVADGREKTDGMAIGVALRIASWLCEATTAPMHRRFLTFLGRLQETIKRDHLDFNVTSEVLRGVQRSFTGFSAAAEEATLSGIFAGQHFRPDPASDHRLGRDVADFVVDHVLLTAQERDEDR